MSLKLTYSVATGQFEKYMREKHSAAVDAAMGAMKDAAKLLKSQGRKNIAAAGLSQRWQNAWRVDVFPKRGKSINAAVFAYHKIPYAGIFERGAVIQGKPLLWVQTSESLRKYGGRRLPPSKAGPLVSINVPGKAPMLGWKGAGGRAEPMYVGIRQARIRKRFGLERLAEGIGEQMPLLFLTHFRDPQ